MKWFTLFQDKNEIEQSRNASLYALLCADCSKAFKAYDMLYLNFNI